MTEKKQKEIKIEEKMGKKMDSSANKKREELKHERPHTFKDDKSQVEDLWSRTDQIASIFGKGLDLVEAGIGLGINVINKLGEQIVLKMPKAEQPDPGHYYTPQEAMGPFYQEEPRFSAEASAPTKDFRVMNRIPIFPGSPVQVSFSINNDSPSSSKKLHLDIQGFVGEVQKFQLDAQKFSIKPEDQVIAPMDFEKFILRGSIPPEAPADNYNGWIVVSGEEKFNILVTLIVTMQP